MNTRANVIKILDKFFLKHKPLEIEGEKPEISRLTNGILKNLTYIDYLIEKTLEKDIKSVQKSLINILRCAIYELVFDTTPEYAIVNSYVEIAKKFSQKSAGFVNAVLKKFIKNKDKISLPQKEQNPLKYLSIKYSHPTWMIQRWINFYGYEKTEEICEYNNKNSGLNIRVNTLKITIPDFIKILEKNNIDYEQNPYLEVCFKIRHHGHIPNILGYKEGYFTVQGVASCLPAKVLSPKMRSKVLDVCASPGGKSLHLSSIMANTGSITSVDITEEKLEKIKENISRLGATNITTLCADATSYEYADKYDYILVDAPCSNTGILSKKADIRWIRKEKDINSITKIQYEILNNSAQYLKDDGYMVYSTCSIEPEENLEVINKFLYNNQKFELYPFILDEKNNGFTQIFPSYLDMEGFFIAKFKKKNNQ